MGSQVGGHFVAGGWTADSLTDSIDYTIAPCVACRIEFDVTNTLSGLVYAQYSADLKWLSMADPNGINGGFIAFRNSLEENESRVRGDGDGSGRS